MENVNSKGTLYMKAAPLSDDVYLSANSTEVINEGRGRFTAPYFQEGKTSLAACPPTYFDTPLAAKQAGENAGYEVVEDLHRGF